MSADFKISASNISKKYTSNVLFEGISFELNRGQSLSIPYDTSYKPQEDSM